MGLAQASMGAANPSTANRLEPQPVSQAREALMTQLKEYNERHECLMREISTVRTILFRFNSMLGALELPEEARPI